MAYLDRTDIFTRTKILVKKLTQVSSQVNNLPQYADNASALAGGLRIGQFYRTGDIVKVVH